MRPPAPSAGGGGGVPVDGAEVALVAALCQLPLQLLPRHLLPLQQPLLVVLALAPVPTTQRPGHRGTLLRHQGCHKLTIFKLYRVTKQVSDLGWNDLV